MISFLPTFNRMSFCSNFIGKHSGTLQTISRNALLQCGYATISSDDMFKFGQNDLGKLYSVPMAQIRELGFDKLYLPLNFKKQIHNLRECVWMFRDSTMNAFKCLNEIDVELPAARLVIFGKFGTGKSITLYQLAHFAYTQGLILLTIPDGMAWSNDNYHEVQMSNYKQGRINSPYWATKMLKTFKWQNKKHWEQLANLKTVKKYLWSQVERTEEGKPITDIVEMGLTAPYLATDCVGALYKELRVHASSGAIKLLVLIDKANGLYGKSIVKKSDKSNVHIDELTLNIQVRKFLFPTWSNGLCAMVADKAVVSDSRDALSIPPDDPQTLFGEEGFEQIKPFIPLETSLYSEEEIGVLHEYYLQKNWIHQKDGPAGEEARKHVMYLSAFNPAYFERICAMSWNLNCTPPLMSTS